MLRLLTRRTRKSAPIQRRSFRPALEQLERRDCPTGPTITMLSVTAGTGKTAAVSGTVSDPGQMSLANISVALSGVVSGTLTTTSNGSFSGTEPASALGTVTAVATDSQGQSSAPAQAQLTATPPTINFTVCVIDHKNVQLTGYVKGPSPGGLTVTFTGEVSGTAVTDSNGQFSVQLQAAGLGSVSASTVDVWGQPSNTATSSVAASPPVIRNFVGTQNGTTWTFTGTVWDYSAPGETVTFGGLLQGQSCTVNSNGTFSITVTIPAGTDGTATAFVTDWFGQQSDTVYFSVVS